MDNERKLGKNARRHTGSGLGAVRPDAMNLGPVEHTPKQAAELAVTRVAVAPKPYTVVDQILATGRNRMAATEPLHRAKNKWTGNS